MIHIFLREGRQYLSTSELSDLQRFSRMYYDLSINPAGIDAIQHLLERVNRMQKEIEELRKHLNMYESRTQEEEAEE